MKAIQKVTSRVLLTKQAMGETNSIKYKKYVHTLLLNVDCQN